MADKKIKVTVEVPGQDKKTLTLRSLIISGVNDADNGKTTAVAYIGNSRDVVQALYHLEKNTPEVMGEILGPEAPGVDIKTAPKFGGAIKN